MVRESGSRRKHVCPYHVRFGGRGVCFGDSVEVAEFVGFPGQRRREVRKVGAAVADGQAAVDLDRGLGHGERFTVAARLRQLDRLPQQRASQGRLWVEFGPRTEPEKNAAGHDRADQGTRYTP